MVINIKIIPILFIIAIIKLNIPASSQTTSSLNNKNAYPIPPTTVIHILSASADKTEIVINADNITHLTSKDNLGVACHLVSWEKDGRSFYDESGNNYIFNSLCENQLKALNVPMSRIYRIYNEPGGMHQGFDRLANVCKRNNIPQDKIIVTLENSKAMSQMDILDHQIYTDAIRYCKTKNYKFKYWEISNEPAMADARSGLNIPENYANHVNDIAKIIKEADPTAMVGCQIWRRTTYYSDRVLDNIDGSKIDWIAGHWYGITNMDYFSPEEVILTENFKDLEYIAIENQNIKNRTGRIIPQIDSEWRLLAWGPSGGKHYDSDVWYPRNGNIIGTLFQAVRLIYCIRDSYTLGANCWNSAGNIPGCLVPAGHDINSNIPIAGKTTYLYWLHKYFMDYTGSYVVTFTGSAPVFKGNCVNSNDDHYDFSKTSVYSGPLTPVIVTKSEDGLKLFITIVNGSTSRTIPFSAVVNNFKAGRQTSVRISDSDIDQNWYQDNKSRFVSTPAITKNGNVYTCELVPLSVTFIILDATL